MDIDINELIKHHGKTRPISFKIALVASIIVFTVLATQIIGLALGIDILKHLFNWGEEVLVITPVSNENIVILDEANTEIDEPIRYVFENETQIPDILIDHCSIFKNMDYQFCDGRYLNDGVSETNTVRFAKDNIDLQIRALKNVDSDIEKDNEYYEEYPHNNKIYHIFKNLEYFMVVWDDSEYIYHLNTNLPIDEVKAIIQKF